MAVSFQEQSRKRKVIYSVLILSLFTGTLLYRLNLMDPTAQALALRQEQQGAVELTGSALRLTLTGSRGLAVCILWWTAIEKQKRHEWNKLATLVRSVTKLQPHFITPWLFQSWNLAYNVSVENDRHRDKYFYITQGMELLADGERKNRGYIIDTDGSRRELNHPELCFNLGFYYQQKIGTHDNQNTLLSLLQMSTIDPRERHPDYLLRKEPSGEMVVDMERFEKFCKAHPVLVRRLREVLGYSTPREIVDFLDANKKLPTRFDEETVVLPGTDFTPSRLKRPLEQFPVLARTTEDPEKLVDDSADGRPDAPTFSTFTAARGWFKFAQRPLPKPDPTFLTEIKDTYDKTRYRMPKSMAHLIFRGYPARAQDYVATHLQREGWFDEDGWRIQGWWLPDDEFRPGEPALVARGQNWATEAWREAANLYYNHGIETGLYIFPETQANLERLARQFQKAMNITPDYDPRTAPDEDSPLRKGYEAHVQLFWYHRFRSMTNFPHFYYKTLVEKEAETVQARKAFFQAERLRRTAQSLRALEHYTEALPAWRKLLRANKDFRRDQNTQEETYETQKKYLALARSDRRPLKELKLGGPDAEDWRAPAIRHLLITQERLAKAGTWAALVPVHLAEIGPFDWIDDPKSEDAQPLIGEQARSTVESRK